jgi:hypothetical protein
MLRGRKAVESGLINIENCKWIKNSDLGFLDIKI